MRALTIETIVKVNVTPTDTRYTFMGNAEGYGVWLNFQKMSGGNMSANFTFNGQSGQCNLYANCEKDTYYHIVTTFDGFTLGVYSW